MRSDYLQYNTVVSILQPQKHPLPGYVPRSDCTPHPGSIPQIVVVLKPEVGDYDDVKTPNANTLEGWLWDYMEEQQYTSVDYAYAQVYVSPLIG